MAHVADKDRISVDLYVGKALREMRRFPPMRSRPAAVEQDRSRQIEGARADRADAPRLRRTSPDPRDELRLKRAMLVDRDARDDQRVDRLVVERIEPLGDDG